LLPAANRLVLELTSWDQLNVEQIVAFDVSHYPVVGSKTTKVKVLAGDAEFAARCS